MASKILKVVVPMAFLVVGAIVVLGILRLSPPPAEAAERVELLNVEVHQLESRSARPIISGTGEVSAAEQVTVSPEVSGRVVRRHESLIPGGRISEGEVLARIDAREYRLALRQEEARVRSSRLEVETEQGRRRVAEQEWNLLGDNRSRDDARLALREPHVAAAEANLDSSEAGVERARLNLTRTTIRAPFNAVVVDAAADVGQLVSQTSRMATLVGTDVLWVQVSVPISRLPDMDVPGVNAEEGATARVTHDLGGGRRVVREGRVLRLQSQLDSETRTASVIVAVENPFDEPEGAVPLLPGAFVTVEFEGREAEGVLAVPRAAVHQGRTVWVVTEEDRLEQREFEVRWGSEDQLFVASDELEAGDRIVVSPLASPVDGVRVQVTESREREAEEVDDDQS